MFKGIIKNIGISFTMLLLFTCDNYEFPKSPYPRIVTLPVVNILETGVTFQGIITQLGQKEITNHGFVWGLDKNPLISNDDKIQLGAKSNPGSFGAEVKYGLAEGVTYFVKAFVATEDYFVYGEAVAFTSKGSTPPKIKSFLPAEGTWGDTITIKGNYFSALPRNNVVKFSSLESKVVLSNDSTIMCIVPDNIKGLLVSIDVQVAGNIAVAPEKFQLTVPQIDDFTPTSGTFLDEVTIIGSNFGALKTHIVTIGGHVAEVVASSRTSLKVKIPVETHLKVNPIKLELNQQAVTAATSLSMFPPTITSISKVEGRIGDEVEIEGTNFNPHFMGNLVLFGESQATVLSATSHSLKVKLTNGVYPQRNSSISITVAEQTATASSKFNMLDPWLKKPYTPLAEVGNGGFAINNMGYFIAGSKTYSYDPLTSNWARKADFPGEFRLSSITFAAAGQGYSGGGTAKDFWRYSPSTNTWTMRNEIPDESRGTNGTSTGGKGYTVQGAGPTQMSAYDPSVDTWTTTGETLEDFTGYTYYPNNIFAMADRVFVFFRDDYNYTFADNYLYEFEVPSGNWTRRAAYFDERSEGFSINGIGYIKGFKSIHKYDLNTNQLTLNISPLANGYWGMVYLFSIYDKAYFLGYWENSQFEFWEFDPAYL